MIKMLLRSFFDPFKTIYRTIFPIFLVHFGTNKRSRLHLIGLSGGPTRIPRDQYLIVGPWVSELGFELLYWIPFIRRYISDLKKSPDRVVVVSRGGTDALYSDVCREYVEIFDYMDEVSFKKNFDEHVKEFGGQKHLNIRPYESILIERIKNDRPYLKGAAVLHPSVMYRSFQGYWSRRLPARFIRDFSQFNLISREELRQPKASVAASAPLFVCYFYDSDAFSLSSENKVILSRCLSILARSFKVILIEKMFDIDDHFCDSGWVPQSQNIEVVTLECPRTSVNDLVTLICKANFFVTIYGGCSYLGLFYGVKTFALFTNLGRIVPVHLDLSLRIDRYLTQGQFDRNVAVAPNSPVERQISNLLHPMHLHSFETLVCLGSNRDT